MVAGTRSLGWACVGVCMHASICAHGVGWRRAAWGGMAARRPGEAARRLSLRGGSTGGAPPAGLQRPIRCIVFDKDGTLISFHHTWSPWAEGLLTRISAHAAAHVREQVRDKGFSSADVDGLVARAEGHARKEVAATLGYDLSAGRVHGERALLAWAANPLVRDAVQTCLAERLGFGAARAAAAVATAWRECDGKEEVVPLSSDTPALMARLRAQQIKIAVCTSDARAPTEANLVSLGVADLVDDVVCGDDAENVPKPAPENLERICARLVRACGGRTGGRCVRARGYCVWWVWVGGCDIMMDLPASRRYTQAHAHTTTHTRKQTHTHTGCTSSRNNHGRRHKRRPEVPFVFRIYDVSEI